MGWERGQIMPVELPDHEEDTSPTLSFASSSLAELLAQAREALLAYGVRTRRSVEPLARSTASR